MVSWKGSLSRLLRPEGLAIRIAFASLALAVIAGLWLYVESRQRGAPPPQAKVEKPRTEQAQPTEPEATIPTAREDEAAQKKEAGNSGGVAPRQKPSPQTHRVTAPEVASFVLTPGLTREAGGTNKLVIPPGVQYLRLQLSVESGKNYKGYRASLLRIGGAEVWSRAISGSQLEGGGKSAVLRSLELSLPARLLSGGEYLLTLTGTTEAGESEVVGDYPFTAARQ